jgi:LAGLIDADG endonuclease
VGSRERLLFDPVTTEAKAEMTFLPNGKFMNVIRRRPFEPMIDIPSYISGYVDGEGCFCVSMRPQPRIRVGWEVRPSFSVSQNEDRAGLIRLLPIVFGGGTIRPDRSDRTLKFEIRSLRVLLNSVIPFFETYPLLSSKRNDFELFRGICVSMQRGDHLLPGGLLAIANLAQQMNAGVRKYTVESIQMSSKVKG